MSPREYRKVGALPEETVEVPRRGRPSAQKEGRPKTATTAPPAAISAVEADGLVEDVQVDAAPGVRHHVLPVRPDTIHWGYFSKHLKPALEVCSGDYVTVETLTHHANDDAERMIDGDPAAEAVYRWTAEGKVVDRRGAGPSMPRSSGAGRARALACTSAPARSPLPGPSRAMWCRCASSISIRAPAATRALPGAPLAATWRPIGASTMPN
jgi:hypothetical protein